MSLIYRIGWLQATPTNKRLFHFKASCRPLSFSSKVVAQRDPYPRQNDNPDGRGPSGQLAGPFVRPAPVISYERKTSCRRCGGTKLVDCGACNGSGKLPAGGYHTKNPISSARIIGSAWTAMERTLGWRHYRVIQKKKQGKDTFVLMAATCDEEVQLWVNIKNLKDRAAWAAGWLQKTEMKALEAQAGGKDCKACNGTGKVPCPLCELAGTVVEL